MNKKLSIILAIVLAITLISLGGIWIWEKNELKKIAEKEKQVEEENSVILTPEPKDIIQQIKKIFFDSSENTNVQVRKNPCFSWVREDGIGYGPSGGWEVSSSRSSRDSAKGDMIQISSLFIENGFIKNDRNYKNSQDVYGVPGETVGFEKGELKCKISWSENALSENDPRLEIFGVSCVKITLESEKDFDDIYSAFKKYDPPAGYSKIDNISSFCVKEKNENFATGLVGTISAPEWYAKKVNGKWIIVIITQDYPPCDKIKDFPKNYYEGKCLYNDINGKLQVKEL